MGDRGVRRERFQLPPRGPEGQLGAQPRTPSSGSRGPDGAGLAQPGPAGGPRSDRGPAPGAAWAPTRALPAGPPQTFFPALEERAAAAPASAPAQSAASRSSAGRARPGERPMARGLGPGPTPGQRGHDELSAGAAAAPGHTRETGRSRRDTRTRAPQFPTHTPCPPGRTPLPSRGRRRGPEGVSHPGSPRGDPAPPRRAAGKVAPLLTGCPGARPATGHRRAPPPAPPPPAQPRGRPSRAGRPAPGRRRTPAPLRGRVAAAQHEWGAERRAAAAQPRSRRPRSATRCACAARGRDRAGGGGAGMGAGPAAASRGRSALRRAPSWAHCALSQRDAAAGLKWLHAGAAQDVPGSSRVWAVPSPRLQGQGPASVGLGWEHNLRFRKGQPRPEEGKRPVQGREALYALGSWRPRPQLLGGMSTPSSEQNGALRRPDRKTHPPPSLLRSH